jgi:hypothetical protein
LSHSFVGVGLSRKRERQRAKTTTDTKHAGDEKFFCVASLSTSVRAPEVREHSTVFLAEKSRACGAERRNWYSFLASEMPRRGGTWRQNQKNVPLVSIPFVSRSSHCCGTRKRSKSVETRTNSKVLWSTAVGNPRWQSVCFQ